MTAAAIISGDFSTFRHVQGRKVLQMIIEVPAEQAASVFSTFGYPGSGNPIPVAVARLVEEPAAEEKRERTPFTELPLSQQAALRCAEPDFYTFMCSKFRPDSIIPYDPKRDEKSAPSVPMLRHHLKIGSRRDLDLVEEKGKAWLALEAEYYAWQRGRR